jgi:hypothetical protein
MAQKKFAGESSVSPKTFNWKVLNLLLEVLDQRDNAAGNHEHVGRVAEIGELAPRSFKARLTGDTRAPPPKMYLGP